ncbi:hypothetical protein NF27_EM00120 [Candidatus Jidaibacter acanthamoeba]|uniref:HTH luxR-type domain-containing protein n=1 Tax=Candidatus Jidaibacter acanthamoebae TaxID=86105 RepID=A0A0C1MYZ4_9RICK|nr:helix-turn-helix transcriptional regulator [Candidatus Jidaibacter acanthamoeba]KIE05186.1 hypothetical protein NF27_EM00120 [Candidatus Jidaibacter acanthamoeba]
MKDIWDYAIEVQSELNEICKPLEEGNIKFAYDRIFTDYSVLTLVNYNRNWLEFCKTIRSDAFNNHRANRLYLSEVLSTPIGKLNHFLWSTKLLDGNDSMLIDKFNVGNGISFFQKKHDIIECWSFVMDCTHEQGDLFLLDNISFLKQFILYFNHHSRSLVENLISSKISLPKLPKELVLSIIKQNNDQQITTKNIQIQNYSINITENNCINLTKREVECLQNLALGKSVKEIANILGISDRTVEVHLNNIKLKSGYNHRSQLVSMYLKSDINIIK